MITPCDIRGGLDHTIDAIDFPGQAERYSGKVRETFILPNGAMAIVVTDRVSVFDHKIGTIPYKGQVLNQLAAWWFAKLDEIDIPHHLIAVPHPNVSSVRRAKPLPIELVVRAYLTGTTTTSSWYAYQHHDRMISGLEMPPGMRKNEKFPHAIFTPSTKPAAGHDRNISKAEILTESLVDRPTLELAERFAMRMFAHGQRVAAERGLILVDTKYEMGATDDGSLIVIDEVHTPDSSRYWLQASYEERMKAGQEPESLDKEFVRRMIVNAGYDVDSDELPGKYLTDVVRADAAEKYIQLFECMTAKAPDLRPVDAGEITRVLEGIAKGA